MRVHMCTYMCMCVQYHCFPIYTFGFGEDKRENIYDTAKKNYEGRKETKDKRERRRLWMKAVLNPRCGNKVGVVCDCV